MSLTLEQIPFVRFNFPDDTDEIYFASNYVCRSASCLLTLTYARVQQPPCDDNDAMHRLYIDR